jgi:hypothetical protein
VAVWRRAQVTAWAFFLLARAIIAVARAASLRILPISDIAANYLFIWIRRLVNLTVHSAFAV